MIMEIYYLMMYPVLHWLCTVEAWYLYSAKELKYYFLVSLFGWGLELLQMVLKRTWPSPIWTRGFCSTGMFGVGHKVKVVWFSNKLGLNLKGLVRRYDLDSLALHKYPRFSYCTTNVGINTPVQVFTLQPMVILKKDSCCSAP